jgi:hypothetical protein
VTAPAGVYVPNKDRLLAEACADDFGRFAYDGFGIMLSDQQLEAQKAFGTFGPRLRGEPKNNWLSGGQRGGKTVLGFLIHADGCIYKRGVDNTDARFWKNYAYGTLHIAPINDLALRMYNIGSEISKGANDSQWDRAARRSRGGAWLHKLRPGKSGVWGIIRWSNGAFIDFRSSEGAAYRLEGGQWWGATWDEWASQPDHEIYTVRSDVLLGRLRDHDAKLLAMAWPKPETEHHLIAVMRDIEAGRDTDSQVIFLSSADAYFTNARALEVEKRTKTEAQWKRTVEGRPAGGAAIEFKSWMVEHMVNRDLPKKTLPEEGFAYLNSADLGMANDSTVELTWRIPIVGGKRLVSPQHKARLVDSEELKGSAGLTLDTITYSISARQQLYHAQTALDATAMGGIAAIRNLRDLRPPPLAFVARSNDRLHGNMRLAAITNAMDLLTWGRPDSEEIAKHHKDPGYEPPVITADWGCIEIPDITELIDQLLAFDRDAKNQKDDWVWAFLIGLWYIRRLWVVGQGRGHRAIPFDPRQRGDRGGVVRRGTRRIPLLGQKGRVEEQESAFAARPGVVRWGRRG